MMFCPIKVCVYALVCAYLCVYEGVYEGDDLHHLDDVLPAHQLRVPAHADAHGDARPQAQAQADQLINSTMTAFAATCAPLRSEVNTRNIVLTRQCSC
jgi:hypothetical protein